MNGIRTYFRNDDIPESGFQRAYRPLYSLLDGLYFVDAYPRDSCFSFPWEDETIADACLDASLQVDQGWRLYKAAVLIDHAQYITDDWNAILLSDLGEITSNRTLLNHIQSSAYPINQDKQHRVLFFHNFDGCFWQFFTNDIRFIDAIIKANRSNPDFDLRSVQYDQDYPNPGRYRKDYPPPIA